jgi:Uma2 family endonuclease
MNGWCGSTAQQLVFQIPKSLLYRAGEKPFIESIHGRLEPKVSPETLHGRLQTRLGMWLVKWAQGCGEVGTEWRCYLIAGEARPSSLVPDVAYLSYKRWPRDLPMDARQRPRTAPDIAVEIVSSDACRHLLDEKIRLYLAHGTSTVIVVYARERMLAFHCEDAVQVVSAKGYVPVPGYGDLVLDADGVFGEPSVTASGAP